MYIYALYRRRPLIMSDIFAGIKGADQARPDVIMNKGPLPSLQNGGGPAYQGIPDGKINQTSSLLKGIEPYSYGEGARMGTQSGYLNIPHVVQRIVPQISIPKPDRGWMALSHQLDDGKLVCAMLENIMRKKNGVWH